MAKIDFDKATHRGLRENNQDAYFITDNPQNVPLGKLFVVTDGVGGNVAGDWAAQTAAKILHDFFYKQRAKGVEIPEALKLAFLVANKAVSDRAQHEQVQISCTAVVAAVHQTKLYLAHVGDARAYLLRQDGSFRQLTTDHSWVQEQVRLGVINPEQAQNHELRHIITRSIGNRENIEPEISKPIRLKYGDRLLLCSDGLYNTLSIEEMLSTLRDVPIERAAQALVGQGKERSQDNLTAVTFAAIGSAFTPAPPPPRPWWYAYLPLLLTLLLILCGLGFITLRVLNNNLLDASSVAPTSPAPTIQISGTNLLPVAPTATLSPILQPTSTLGPTASPTITATATTTPQPSRLACISNIHADGTRGTLLYAQDVLHSLQCIYPTILPQHHPITVFEQQIILPVGHVCYGIRRDPIILHKIETELGGIIFEGWVRHETIRFAEQCP